VQRCDCVHRDSSSRYPSFHFDLPDEAGAERANANGHPEESENADVISGAGMT